MTTISRKLEQLKEPRYIVPWFKRIGHLGSLTDIVKQFRLLIFYIFSMRWPLSGQRARRADHE
jgi:hypothetical protein